MYYSVDDQRVTIVQRSSTLPLTVQYQRVTEVKSQSGRTFVAAAGVRLFVVVGRGGGGAGGGAALPFDGVGNVTALQIPGWTREDRTIGRTKGENYPGEGLGPAHTPDYAVQAVDLLVGVPRGGLLLHQLCGDQSFGRLRHVCDQLSDGVAVDGSCCA